MWKVRLLVIAPLLAFLTTIVNVCPPGLYAVTNRFNLPISSSTPAPVSGEYNWSIGNVGSDSTIPIDWLTHINSIESPVLILLKLVISKTPVNPESE